MNQKEQQMLRAPVFISDSSNKVSGMSSPQPEREAFDLAVDLMRDVYMLPSQREAYERILQAALSARAQGEADGTFAERFAHEMPAGTVIGDPAWWANSVARQYEKRVTPAVRAVDVAKFSLHDRVEFALRDAGFDYDEAFRIATLATPKQQAVEVDGYKTTVADVRGWMKRNEWNGSLDEASIAIDDARSLHALTQPEAE